MRHIVLRALEFSASGGVTVVVANVLITVSRLPQGELPSARFWLAQIVVALAVGVVLGAGAFVGFVVARAREVDTPSALALGILAGLPAILVGSSLLTQIGPAGVVAAAIAVASLIAAVGSGGLRGAGSHG